MHAEVGVYETYIMTDRKLLDRTVASGLETLIGCLRKGSLVPRTESDEICYSVGQEEALLIENIRRNWAMHFAKDGQPTRDKRIGVLRTILGSVETMRSPDPQSQSYLKHIAKFLTEKLGVSVQAFSADMKPLPDPDEDSLMVLGREWAAQGDPEARAEFFELAADLMRNGESGRVVDACQLLMGEVTDLPSEVSEELIQLNGKARQTLITAIG